MNKPKYGFPKIHYDHNGKTFCGRHSTIHAPLMTPFKKEVNCHFCLQKIGPEKEVTTKELRLEILKVASLIRQTINALEVIHPFHDQINHIYIGLNELEQRLE